MNYYLPEDPSTAVFSDCIAKRFDTSTEFVLLRVTRVWLAMLTNLRIAVTALCLTACVLLVALWVRSYSLRDYIWAHSSWSLLGITSMYGGILFQIDIGATNLGPDPDNLGVYSEPNVEWLPWWEIVAGPSKLGFRLTKFPRSFIVPHWFLILVSTSIAAIPWIPWSRNFSLRTLLIATTLAAVEFGLVVYLER